MAFDGTAFGVRLQAVFQTCLWRASKLIGRCRFLRRSCMHVHRAVAVKSIRLNEGLGGKDYDVSGLKVLHLVRDPRAVVRSQQLHLRTSWGRRGQVQTDNRSTSHAGGVRCEVKRSSAGDHC